MGKEEIACYEQFLLFPQCFQKLSVVDALKWVPIEKKVKLLHWNEIPSQEGFFEENILEALTLACMQSILQASPINTNFNILSWSVTLTLDLCQQIFEMAHLPMMENKWTKLYWNPRPDGNKCGQMLHRWTSPSAYHQGIITLWGKAFENEYIIGKGGTFGNNHIPQFRAIFSDLSKWQIALLRYICQIHMLWIWINMNLFSLCQE